MDPEVSPEMTNKGSVHTTSIGNRRKVSLWRDWRALGKLEICNCYIPFSSLPLPQTDPGAGGALRLLQVVKTQSSASLNCKKHFRK